MIVDVYPTAHRHKREHDCNVDHKSALNSPRSAIGRMKKTAHTFDVESYDDT